MERMIIEQLRFRAKAFQLRSSTDCTHGQKRNTGAHSVWFGSERKEGAELFSFSCPVERITILSDQYAIWPLRAGKTSRADLTRPVRPDLVRAYSCDIGLMGWKSRGMGGWSGNGCVQ